MEIRARNVVTWSSRSRWCGVGWVVGILYPRHLPGRLIILNREPRRERFLSSAFNVDNVDPLPSWFRAFGSTAGWAPPA